MNECPQGSCRASSFFFGATACAALAALLSLAPATLHAQSQCTAEDQRVSIPSARCTASRVATLRQSSATLRKEAAVPLSAGLPPSDLPLARRYVSWLGDWAQRLESLATRGDAALASARGGDSRSLSAQRQVLTPKSSPNPNDPQVDFTRQYLETQQQMVREMQQFDALQTLMKASQDAAMNVIRNIRG